MDDIPDTPSFGTMYVVAHLTVPECGPSPNFPVELVNIQHHITIALYLLLSTTTDERRR